jgi:hypothetical protein
LFCLRVITVNPALVTSGNPGHVGCIQGGLFFLVSFIMMLVYDSFTRAGRSKHHDNATDFQHLKHYWLCLSYVKNALKYVHCSQVRCVRLCTMGITKCFPYCI